MGSNRLLAKITKANGSYGNLKETIGLSVGTGMLSSQLSSPNFDKSKIQFIHQSVTGLFETRKTYINNKKDN